MTQAPPDAATAAIIQHFLTDVAHVKVLGIAYHGHGSDWAELAMPFAPQQLADPDYGIIASGAIFTLMDSAAGFSVMITSRAPVPCATLDLRVDYLRAPKPGATIIGRGQCYRRAREVAFVRGQAHDGDTGDPIANMAGTFMFTRTPVVGR